MLEEDRASLATLVLAFPATLINSVQQEQKNISIHSNCIIALTLMTSLRSLNTKTGTIPIIFWKIYHYNNFTKQFSPLKRGFSFYEIVNLKFISREHSESGILFWDLNDGYEYKIAQ